MVTLCRWIDFERLLGIEFLQHHEGQAEQEAQVHHHRAVDMRQW